jgi:hypothetical protein
LFSLDIFFATNENKKGGRGVGVIQLYQKKKKNAPLIKGCKQSKVDDSLFLVKKIYM